MSDKLFAPASMGRILTPVKANHGSDTCFVLVVKEKTRNTKFTKPRGENMKNLKRLGLSFSLICILAMATFAGETPTGPCPPPAPGETPTGPCATVQVTADDSLASNDAGTLTEAEYSITEATIDFVQSVLLLF